MRAQRPLHYLAKVMHQSSKFSSVKKHDDMALLVEKHSGERIAVYLFENCPTTRTLGHILAQNTQANIFTLLCLPGDLLFQTTAQLERTLAMLDIFYPHKAYVHKVMEDDLHILPVFLTWAAGGLDFQFALPVDLLNLKTRTVHVEQYQLCVADFGAHPPYNPQERFKHWQARYGNGNKGRRTGQRRRAKRRSYYGAHAYYEILGLDPSATFEEIKFAYRQLARELHPDINTSPQAKAKMQKINEAYAALTKAKYILRK